MGWSPTMTWPGNVVGWGDELTESGGWGGQGQNSGGQYAPSKRWSACMASLASTTGMPATPTCLPLKAFCRYPRLHRFIAGQRVTCSRWATGDSQAFARFYTPIPQASTGLEHATPAGPQRSEQQPGGSCRKRAQRAAWAHHISEDHGPVGPLVLLSKLF